MKLRNVMTALGTAAATVAVTLTLAALANGERAEAAAVKPTIGRPQLTSQGCNFTLKTDRETYEEGESPVFEVTATNTTQSPVKATVWVTVSATSPVTRMSRMLPRPHVLSSQEVAFSLEPGQTVSKKVTCEAKLPAGQSVSIVLGDKKSAIMPVTPTVQPAANATNAPAPAARK
jgi:hypothetical protein